MRLQSIFGFLVGSLSLLQHAVAQVHEPVVLAIASFPEDNAFANVVNGQPNKMVVSIQNKTPFNVTLKNIAGSIHRPDSGSLVKNTSALSYNVPLVVGAGLQLPYSFHSEFKPGEWRLNIWLEHETQGKTYRVTAYDSIVNVVEPEISAFDLKLLSTYLMVASMLAGLGFYLYTVYVPQPKKRKVPQVSAPVGTVTATGAGGYQEEWIPEHHLKKPNKKAKASGAATSGDETSGAEVSGAETRRRKGRK